MSNEKISANTVAPLPRFLFFVFAKPKGATASNKNKNAVFGNFRKSIQFKISNETIFLRFCFLFLSTYFSELQFYPIFSDWDFQFFPKNIAVPRQLDPITFQIEMHIKINNK